ncbi:nucleotidyltransferase domain-containing protein [Streptomyces albidoflavus]
MAVSGVDERRAARQLALIEEALRAARRTGAELWLRGGWAMDFTLGRLTRDHGDIDWFTWAGGADALARELTRLGYAEVPGPPPGLQRDFAKDGLESSFTLIDRDHLGRIVVAGGPWAGTPWPQDLLDGGPGRLGGLSCPVVAPRAQIEIKRMMPVWNPALPRREKDRADIALLERHLGV